MSPHYASEGRLARRDAGKGWIEKIMSDVLTLPVHFEYWTNDNVIIIIDLFGDYSTL